MSREHANVICAFVMEEINRASCSAGPTESGFLENRELSGKAYLKQNLFYMNQADYDSFGRPTDGGPPKEMGQLKINLLLTILSGLRQHAVSDKRRLAKLLDESNDTGTAGDSELPKTLASFQACTDAIVDIGERCLLRLPVNKQGRQLGGMVVRGLVEAYADSDGLTEDKPLAYLAERMDGRLRSVIDPLRYADAVADAASNALLDPSRKRVLNEIGEQRTVEQLIGFQPPRDAQDVVRGLFMRDLVDLKVSGCGYGDFLSWCHLPFSPEPLLFDYVSNFPSMSREDADGGRRNEHWVIDEVSFVCCQRGTWASPALTTHPSATSARTIYGLIKASCPRGTISPSSCFFGNGTRLGRQRAISPTPFRIVKRFLRWHCVVIASASRRE